MSESAIWRGLRRAILFCGLVAFILAFQVYAQRGGDQRNPPGRQGGGRAGEMQGGRGGRAGNMQGGRGGRAGDVQGNRGGVVPPTRPGAAQATRPGQTPPGIFQPSRPATAQPNRSRTSRTPEPNIPARMQMRLEENRVIADIRVTPLQQVLNELAARSGVIFEVESQENPPVSIALLRVPLEEAIKRLTDSNNSIIYYDQDEAGRSQVSFVRVFSRNPLPHPPSLLYIGTGEVTKRGFEDIDNPEQAITVLAESDDLDARQRAVDALVSYNGPVTIPALKIALTDPAPEVRVAALEGLASLGASEALKQILPALRDTHPGVRHSAILAVSLLGDIENVKDLRPLIRDPDASVAASAEVALRKLSSKRP